MKEYRPAMTIRPMLAATVEESNLHTLGFPLLASPKMDGIRAIITDGRLLSRSGKPIPNTYIRSCLEKRPEWEGLDGELIVGPPTAKNCFRVTTSAVMTQAGEPDFKFHVFDYYGPGGFQDRLNYAYTRQHHHVVAVQHTPVYNLDDLITYELNQLSQGYEGVMLRQPTGFYKTGRSTMREQGLMKLKRFCDSEATVIDVEERMHNGNVVTTDALGYTERSSHKENKVGRGDLGALLVQDLKTGVEFSIGTGFDDSIRHTLWQDKPIGKVVKYKYFPSGSKDRPRFPVFIGFRSVEDM